MRHFDWPPLVGLRRPFIRNLAGPDLFLSFLLSAVGAVLAIRFFLHLTGYPQVGEGGLHIAHMLWGGLLLLAALLVHLGFLDRAAHQAAAILGGLGWGTFIDELGKFITRDHNYFFAPTVALIYLSFVGLYLAFQAVARTRPLSDDEYEVNAMRVIEEALVEGLTVDHRARVAEYLGQTRAADPMARAIAQLVATLDAQPAPSPSPLQRWRDRWRPAYRALVRHQWFRTGLELAFGLYAVLGVAQAVALTGFVLPGGGRPTASGFADQGLLFCSSVAGLFVGAGILTLPRSRRRAYQHLRTSVLVRLLTEFFVFLQAQFAALPGFAFNLLLLAGLDQLLAQEQALPVGGALAPPRPVGSGTEPPDHQRPAA